MHLRQARNRAVEAALHAALWRVVAVLALRAARVLRPRGLGLGRLGLAVGAFPPNVLCVGQLVVLLPLHASILEPYFDLTLGQDERVGYLDPPTTREVAVVVELLLELQNLVPRVGRPLTLGLHAWLVGAVC